jgi:alkanesulfonate monooxygenase SsuD/methylene tetrahydromethanopterin reductase-like flavin-dependent oxidoreductase (luciferase family)
VFAAATEAEARFLRSSSLQSFLNLRTGRPGRLPPPVEDLDAQLSGPEREILAQISSCSAVGTPDTVRDEMTRFVERTGVDEVIVASHIFAHDKRLESYRLAAEAAADATPVRTNGQNA